ncbi:MAG: type IV pilus modification protein PilV [Pseudomonadota bacterium]
MKRKRHRRQQGFTLIEALVALLVLSIGLLGVAAMQLKSLQGAHAAYQRSIASLAAQDAQERLWAELASETETSGSITCPTSTDAGTIQGDWRGEWGNYLPGFSNGSTIAEVSDCEFDIDVVWGEGRFGDSQEIFFYTVRLPEE